MSIITISRELGSLGTQVATLLRNRTEAQFLDRESVEARMQKHGIPTDRLSRFDEKRPRFWDRISVHADRYRHFLRTAILDIAVGGDCVILGRGAHVVLADVPGVLRVRVVAPRELRIQRIQQRFDCTETTAIRLLKESDRDRAGFLRFHFGVEWTSPSAYDLVVNTGSLQSEAVVDLILDTVDRLPMAGENATTMRILSDRCLEQHIRTALIFHSDAPLYFLSVAARDGVVTLSGETPNEKLVRKSEVMTYGVPGVVEVNNKILHTRHTPTRPV